MIPIILNKKALVIFGFILSSTVYSQDGHLKINQDNKINELIELKKDINSSSSVAERYKIQIFSGNRSSAERTESKFKSKLANWSSKMVYETPNYKIWIGSFRTRLEADRALVKIQKEFPAAFIFKPKIKD